MISANSRYASSTVVTAQNLDGRDVLVILFDTPQDQSFRFTWHQLTGDEYPDQLAQRHYGDPTLWWVIARANPEITDWMQLPPGTLLRIPVTGALG